MKRHITSATLVLICAAGCHGPDKANIQLRKNEQAMQKRIDDLQRQHEADQASLKTFDDKQAALPELSSDRLSELFTVAQLRISNLTAVTPTEIKLYVTPVDAAGDTLKTSGELMVEAFDLAQSERPLIGKWPVNLKDSGQHWLQSIMFHGYAIHCPLDRPVSASEITVRVTFIDRLTGRKLTAQQVIKASPTTRPS